MAGRKRHSADDIVRKSRRADELAAEGKTGEEIGAELQVSAATLYNWCRAVDMLKTTLKLSERLACKAVGLATDTATRRWAT